jgi:hypothetical protein
MNSIIISQLLFHSDRIDRTRFRDILHNTFDMTDDILMDRGNSNNLDYFILILV